MGSSLKKIVKPLTAIATGGASLLPKRLLLGSNGKSSNPYDAPNMDFLRSESPTVDYSALKSSPDLMRGFRTYKDYYNPSAGVADSRFNQYATAIGAPSSTDQVRGELQRDQLTQRLGDIERDTRGRFGQGIYDYFGRGLFDPTSGGDSTVARTGLAQLAAEGGRTAAGAQTQLGLADIERQAAREAAMRQAYGQRYTAGESQDAATRSAEMSMAGQEASRYGDLYSKNADLENQRMQAYLQGTAGNIDREMQRRYNLANIMNGQAATSASNYRPGDYGLLGKFGESFASSLGSKLGGG